MQGLDICNMAIGMCSGDPITSLTENTPLGLFCQTQYPQKRAYLMGIHRWVFTTRTTALSRVADFDLPAAKPAAYAFVKPADLLGVVHSFRNQAGIDGACQLSVLENEGLYWCDTGSVWAEYTADIDEARWPAWFVELVKTAFAADIARTLQNNSLASAFQVAAFGVPSDNGDGGLYLLARAADARAAPQRTLYGFDNGPLVSVRAEGGGLSWSGEIVDFS